MKRRLEITDGREMKRKLEITDGTIPVPLTSWKFDQEAARMALCEMIILDQLPFKFVEREGFKNFVESLCPHFEIPCRQNLKGDCVRLFLRYKETLKSFFQSKGIERVSISIDRWAATDTTNFICVTAHCIDKDWVLHRKIINVRKVDADNGDELGASIISSLEEWGLQKVLCCTMDIAPANDGAIKYMNPFLEERNMSIAGGKYLHMPCVARIANLIVSDMLEEIGLSVERVREAVRWLMASPDRFERLKVVMNCLKMDCTKSLCLDVPTRWNSTYLMLLSVQPYEAAIKFFLSVNSDFRDDLNKKKYKDQPIGAPEDLDWTNVRRMMVYLGKFYDLTILVSNTSYVTSHIFFKEICDLFDIVLEMEMDTDDKISKLAWKLKKKLRKYWFEDHGLIPRMNKILYIAALLDPRQKMKHVEMCLRVTYHDEDREVELVEEVKKSFHDLFDFYKKQMTLTRAPRANTATTGCKMRRSDRPRGRQFCSLLPVVTDEQPDATDVSEITLYLSEKQYKMTPDEVDDFDILQWWSKHGPHFPVLSAMARDILAIPISSVAYESPFSIESRVLSPFRSSLSPKMVEALICAEDWLKSSSTNIFLEDDEEVSETELEKKFELVLFGLDCCGPGGHDKMTESGGHARMTESEGHAKMAESAESQTS